MHMQLISASYMNLPNEYVSLGYQKRLEYMHNLRQEIEDMQQFLAELRSEEMPDCLLRTAVEVPCLGPLKPRKLHAFKGHTSKVLASCIVRQEKPGGPASVVSVGQENNVIVWDYTTGLKTEVFRVSRGHVLSIAAPPSGKIVAVAGMASTIDLYSVNDSLNVALNHPRTPYTIKPAHALHMEKESANLFCGVSGKEPQQAVQSPTVLSSPRSPAKRSPLHKLSMMKEAENELPSMARLKLSAHRGGQFRGSLSGHKTGVLSLSFCDEGTLISGAADGGVSIWDVPSGSRVSSFQEHAAAVMSTSNDPTSVFGAASGSDDGLIKVWDVRQKQSVMSFHAPYHQPVGVIKFSPEGHTIIGADMGGIFAYDKRTNSIIGTLPMPSQVSALEVTSSGRGAIAGHGDGSISVIDILRAEVAANFKAHKSRVSSIHTVRNAFVTSSWDGFLRGWSLS